jgi:ATP-dependent exoDNAse (exonuclease V) beta subunit
MKFGTKLHYQFEIEDFKNTDNPYILKFLKHIDMNYINCYKEYEFIYNDTIGIIDLMLEYDDHIDIIDYKLSNIEDENYINQLNGYKKYIESITNKKVNIYLYSILKNEIRCLQ